MCLMSDHAIHDVRPHFLEALSPVDICLFVKARQQFKHHRDGLAVARRLNQQLHHLRLRSGAIHRLLDGDHVRIVRCLLEKIYDRRK